MSKLLLDEQPLVIMPTLAAKVGLNESIILQQIHYWLMITTHEIEGKKWVYNSYPEWQKQFPFWSESTIKRTISRLESEGYLLSGNFNQLSFDKTKWYTLNYQKLEGYEPTIGSNCTDEQVNLNRPIPETTTDIKKNNNIRQVTSDEYTPEFEEFWKVYPNKKEKRSAFKCWNTILKAKRHSPEELILAATRYAEECQANNTLPKFIKHAATFLGPRTPYEDYLKIDQPSPQEEKKDDYLVRYRFREG